MNKRVSIKGKGADIFFNNDHNTGIPESQNTLKPAKQIKVTYFINDKTAEKLEEFWFKLRRKFNEKKISKSKIVEVAVNKIVTDWEENKDQSQIESDLKAGVK